MTFAIAANGFGATAPGITITKNAATSGFLSSIAFDRNDALLYSTLAGSIYRLEGTTSVPVATVPTAVGGNQGLLGIARLDDHRIVVHHIRLDHTADLISIVDLDDGSVQPLAALECNHGQPCSAEHHGGHVALTSDGSILVGIGDVGLFTAAQDPTTAAGKIMRILPDGTVSTYASGFRDPFGIVWDSVNGKLIVSENGPGIGDEIDIVSPGDDDGWPATYGNLPNLPGMTPPVYVFPQKIAPTGITIVKANGILGAGVIVASFDTEALYYFSDVYASPATDPLPLVIGETSVIIAVAQNERGEIYFGTPGAIYRLNTEPPKREAARH